MSNIPTRMNSLNHSSVLDSATPRQVDDHAAEAIHLRRLLDTLPSCLMRVGADGFVLAANDAALGLLGDRDLGHVLGSMVTVWIVTEHHDRWREFAATVASGTRCSLECDLIDLSGNHRTVLFHGVPLIDHPDGVPSIMLGARDISASRRLEVALQSGITPARLPQKVISQPARPTGDRNSVPGRGEKASDTPGVVDPGYTVEEGGTRRLNASLVPSITGVRLSPHGGETSLINISSSGVLVRSNTRLVPGTGVTVVFDGTFSPSSVVSRVARCSVTHIDSQGVLFYDVGIVFKEQITLEDGLVATQPRPEPEHQPLETQAVSTVRMNRW